ncbi:IucA/IucC family protein [Rhizohabitans arisaemae]|uniref:IucA/IucC family protein n=1 Tax=Rhizohabitans arisaemae TaxID=2720610 RepID=UPI0024B1C0E1|nr:IucA/IucC family protein [Rhizohabitans arisaemae]
MTAPGDRDGRLAARILDTLLREDYAGFSHLVHRSKEGVALHLPTGRRVPLTPGGLFQDFTVARAAHGLTVAEVLGALDRLADPADRDGVAAFRRECEETLATIALHDAHHRQTLDRLRPADRHGPAGALYYDTLAAYTDHPVYPTGRCRLGLSQAELLAYAPEFHPVFPLRWIAVPQPAPAGLPSWWPGPGDVGLPPAFETGHTLYPVHPLTVPHLPLTELGAVLGHTPYLPVVPTLSMRTVAVRDDPGSHLKLPLATSTLGLRNRRSIKPGTLDDGARAEGLLRRILAREPGARILVADEQTHRHTGHEYAAWMLRRLPEVGPAAEIVSVASLLAPAPGGATVLAETAGRHGGGDPVALLDEYLGVLLRWNVRLFVAYGVALEAHQQNLAMILGDGPLKLLVKDNDGLLASPETLRGAGLPAPRFTDRRMLTDDPHSLADVFVTITLHLACAAVVFGAAQTGLLAVDTAGHLLRRRLAEALDEHGSHPLARLLRARTLDAARLVGKSMVIAGTLVDKTRSGARDVNKFYGTSGPNYLRAFRERKPA